MNINVPYLIIGVTNVNKILKNLCFERKKILLFNTSILFIKAFFKKKKLKSFVTRQRTNFSKKFSATHVR